VLDVETDRGVGPGRDLAEHRQPEAVTLVADVLDAVLAARGDLIAGGRALVEVVRISDGVV